jgi:hypothetical protein
MPRKSVTGLVINAKHARIAPSRGLTGAVRERFVAIVASTPATHFVESDRPLIDAYARTLDLCDQAAEALEREGALIAGRPNAWLRVLAGQTRLAAQLARALRLTPQSRLDRKTAGADAGNRASALERFRGAT